MLQFVTATTVPKIFYKHRDGNMIRYINKIGYK